MSSHSAIVSEVRAGLEALAVPADAPAMQQYMKSTMPYRGVRAPAVRQLCRTVFTSHRLADRADWEATVRELFNQATHREERYAALALIGHRVGAAGVREVAARLGVGLRDGVRRPTFTVVQARGTQTPRVSPRTPRWLLSR